MEHYETTTIGSTEFNLSPAAAKSAADRGAVIITERGKESYVLLSIRDYEQLKGQEPSLAESLDMKAMDDISFDPPKVDVALRIPDFGDDG